MAKSKQTYLKNEKEKLKKQKKQEKQEKKDARKSASNKGKGFESMIAYVDERGNFSSTPPDPRLKEELKPEDIQLGAKQEKEEASADQFMNKGRISYFNELKNYGFIKDNKTKESVFFHLNDAQTPLKLNDLVSFQKVKGPRGISAAMVSKTDS